ncbi:MAG: futalosine hydrolase [Syntrophotaleaceae bacterium]
MIAIVAAVPLETAQLRRSLWPCEVRRCGQRELFLGVLYGHKIALLHSGIGKVNAASAVTALFENFRPKALIVIGCGGAYPDSTLEKGDLVLATEEISADEGVVTHEGFRPFSELGFPLLSDPNPRLESRFPVDQNLLNMARPFFEQVAQQEGRKMVSGSIVTVSTCSGNEQLGREIARRTAGICENMEGAAIAQVCRLYRIPFLELRGISNRVENRDLTNWDLPGAAEIAQLALRAFLQGRNLLPEETA